MATYLDGMDGGKHNSDNAETKTKTYTNSLTLTDLMAANPLDAAKKMCRVILDEAQNLIYDVEDEETNEKWSVDLSEDDEDAVLPQ